MNKVLDDRKLSTTDARVCALLTTLKEKLQELYGGRVHALVLYGSYARGAEREGSDLDVAVVLDDYARPWPEIDRTGTLVAELSLKYGITVSLLPVRKQDWEHNRTLLVRSLHREGVLVG
jgi:predicted nucleotidyltransferase